MFHEDIGRAETPAPGRLDADMSSTTLRTLSVCSACFLGALVGTWFTSPRGGAALLYAPYAVLLVSLVSSPVSSWWLYVLTSSLGSFAAHRSSGVPGSFAALVEV